MKDRLNALKNPYAHLRIEDISIEKVKASPMMWEPIRFLESCPSSDGACAMVLTDEDGRQGRRRRRPAAGVDARCRRPARSRPSFPGRDPVRPRGGPPVRRRRVRPGRHHRSRRQIDMAELYVPFSWHEPIWLEAFGMAEEGEGWKMVDDGTTELGGSLPDQRLRRGAVEQPHRRLGPAPLRRGGQPGPGRGGRASGRGSQAVAIGMAYGANSQYFSTWAVGSSLQPFG